MSRIREEQQGYLIQKWYKLRGKTGMRFFGIKEEDLK